MQLLLTLVPGLPLLSATLLLLVGRHLPKAMVTACGVGSIGLAGIAVALLLNQWLISPEPFSVTLWQWLSVGSFRVDIALHLDQLSIIWLCTITGIGFLIHLYSSEYMAEDSDYSRYFAYLNLFVASMLVLVLADNLLLLFLGWEGVGLCSYLLIGFWYQDAANGAAARKAFLWTRAGDAAMAVGLFLLVAEFSSLDIHEVVAGAQLAWVEGSFLPNVACALIFAGAVGKSAQLPLQTWLPDAMAGPTPVSALIHAATMVTAGIYLLARLNGLYILAPAVLSVVAMIGMITAVVAAFAALAQHDIKRILAYSTISQLGYMFLALGVQAWDAGILHMMTHAFFKALLFLAAGAVIECLHHEQDIRRMGGLRSRLPVPFWSFLIGSAALAALPFTAGFAGKDLILLRVWSSGPEGALLWSGAAVGAFITALYSFKLIFVVFFGDINTEPTRQPGWRMAIPLGVLAFFSIVGGFISLPLDSVVPLANEEPPHGLIAMVTAGIPIVGVLVAYLLFGRQWIRDLAGPMHSTVGTWLAAFWHGGWGMDTLYRRTLVQPYTALARGLRNEPIDVLVNLIAWITTQFHLGLAATQNGQLRRYIAIMVVGLILMLSLVDGGAS